MCVLLWLKPRDFSFDFTFPPLNLNSFWHLHSYFWCQQRAEKSSKKKNLPSHQPSFTLSTSAHISVGACAICGLRFPHQGERRAEGQRARDDDDRSGSFYFLLQPSMKAPPQPVTTQTPHPAQVNIYMGGISMRFPLIHTHTHTRSL